MPIEGPIRELGIQDVLQMLDLAQKTGILTVRSQRMMDDAVVHMVDGQLVFASRRRSMRLLGQQLLREGKLEADELKRALEIQRRNPEERLGGILLKMGAVDQEELDRQLRFQIEETVYDLLGWDEGYFSFEETEVETQSGVRVRVDSLLMEGARRLDEWSRLQARVPSPDTVPVLVPPDPGSGAIDLRPEEWEILAEVDGKRDLRGIASELGRSAFEVAKVVYGLASLRLVTVTDQPVASKDEELIPMLDELELLLADGELETAERRARELQQEYPDRAPLPLIAGRALVGQGRFSAAANSFDRAVALDPLSGDAHYLLGLAAARVGELDRATEAWQTYLQLDQIGGRRGLVESGLDAIGKLTRILESAPTE